MGRGASRREEETFTVNSYYDIDEQPQDLSQQQQLVYRQQQPDLNYVALLGAVVDIQSNQPQNNNAPPVVLEAPVPNANEQVM